jgi:hypothetical protein
VENEMLGRVSGIGQLAPDGAVTSPTSAMAPQPHLPLSS